MNIVKEFGLNLVKISLLQAFYCKNSDIINMKQSPKRLALVLTLLLITMASLPLSSAQPQLQQITITPQGSVVGTNTITKNNNTYTLTADLQAKLLIQKDNIILDGAGFTLQGTATVTTDESGLNWFAGPEDSGITLDETNNVVIKNFKITNFAIGISLRYSSNCALTNNTLFKNNGNIFLNESSENMIINNRISTAPGDGISSEYADKNLISQNWITNCCSNGISIFGSQNLIVDNNLSSCPGGIAVGSSYAKFVSGSYNRIIGNNVSNGGTGLELRMGASNNFFTKNVITRCGEGVEGLDDEEGYNNTFYLNTFERCTWATLNCNQGNQSIFYFNNFLENANNVDTFVSDRDSPIIVPEHNYDNGTYGNYWSDYAARYPNEKEANNTGTYNTPYMITSTKDYPFQFYDYHPLVDPITFSQNTTDLENWQPTSPNQQIAPPEWAIILAIVIITAILTVALAMLLYVRRRNTV
jgi:parallel beta-helix repeat protein